MRRLPLLHYILPSSHYALLSLLFFVGLELIFAIQRWTYIFLAILIALMMLGVFLVRYEERHHFRLNQLVLPLLAITGLTGFGFFLANNLLLHLYFILAAILFFWLLKHGSKKAYPTWNWGISTVIHFLNLTLILGLHFQQLIDLFPTIVLSFAVSFLVSVQAVRRVAPRLAEATLIALAIALSLTELVWLLQFLPGLHYIIQAGVIVAFYYIFFNIIRLSFERQLKSRDIWEYGTIGTIALLIILLTTKWT